MGQMPRRTRIPSPAEHLIGPAEIAVPLVVHCSCAADIAKTLKSGPFVAASAGRFATDLYVWSSWEFRYVEIADGLTGTISIMPQKPTFARAYRVPWRPGDRLDDDDHKQSAAAMSMDLDHTFGDDLFGRYTEVTFGSLRPMQESVRPLIVHEKRMAEAAAVLWNMASHLVDELVRRYE